MKDSLFYLPTFWIFSLFFLPSLCPNIPSFIISILFETFFYYSILSILFISCFLFEALGFPSVGKVPVLGRGCQIPCQCVVPAVLRFPHRSVFLFPPSWALWLSLAFFSGVIVVLSEEEQGEAKFIPSCSDLKSCEIIPKTLNTFLKNSKCF